MWCALYLFFSACVHFSCVRFALPLVFCLIICAYMYSDSRHMFVSHISIFTIFAVLL